MNFTRQKLLQGALVLLVFVQASWASPKGGKSFRIVCSFYPMYVMALNVAEDTPGVRVECMTEPTAGCLHDYQLTPMDLKELGSADALVVNGAGMESFIDKAAGQSPNLEVIEASKGMKLEFNDNPHVWVSVSGAIQETRNIANGLAKADPAHAHEYETNAAAYVAKLEALRTKMHTALDPLKGRKVITFHEAFPYFASEFGLKIAAVVEREPGSEPSAGELARTVETVKNQKVQAIFAEPQYPMKSAEVIHRETGVPVHILDPGVTGPKEPALARESYLTTMERNLEVLVKALK